MVGLLVAGAGVDRFARDPLRAMGGGAVARTPPHAGAAVGLRFGVAVGALFLVDQGLPVGDRDLVVIGVDFAEGQEAMAVAAIVDEGGLERRLDPGYLGEIDITAELAAAGGLEIEFLDPVAAKHDHPGLLRMGRIDKHLVWHCCVSWRRVRMRCCGAGRGAPGKGWERRAWERIKWPDGARDRAASATALRPGSGRSLSAIANMADRPLNRIGNA